MAPGALGTGLEEVQERGRRIILRKGGGEEVRDVGAVCDVCAAHGDRAGRECKSCCMQ